MEFISRFHLTSVEMYVNVVDADTLNVVTNKIRHFVINNYYAYMFVFFTPLFDCKSLCLINNCVVSRLSEPHNDSVQRAPSAGRSNQTFNKINTKLFEF